MAAKKAIAQGRRPGRAGTARAASTAGRGRPEEVVIRRAGRADATLIHALVLGLARTLGVTEKITCSPEDIQREGFGAKPAFEALLAERRGEAIGLCLFFDSFSSWSGGRGVYVQDLFVSGGARGQDLGRRLLAETAAIVRARGGTYLRLSVDANNALAQGFYQRVGLHLSATERIYQMDEPEFNDLANGATGTLA